MLKEWNMSQSWVVSFQLASKLRLSVFFLMPGSRRFSIIFWKSLIIGTGPGFQHLLSMTAQECENL